MAAGRIAAGRIAAAVVAMLAATASVAAAEKLTVYTSMKESLIGQIRDAFVKANPDIQFDYYSAGAGKLMAKIAAERKQKMNWNHVLSAHAGLKELEGQKF